MSSSVLTAAVWGGALLTLAGLALLVVCILRVVRAKNAGLSDDAMAEVLQRAAPLNLGGLCIAALGLMCVVVGLVLG